tara:strand:- start:548 stop:2053 length:1506 start_codon:yes stop_codon:yes gene_type:complete
MAIAFLNDINLSNNEIQNVIIQRLGTDPTGVEGKIIYNNGSNTIKYFNGTDWIELDGLGGLQGSGTIGTVPTFVTNTTTLGDSALITSGSGATQTFTFNTSGLVLFKGNVELGLGLQDGNSGLGTNGQLLSSTGTKTSWINAPVSYTKWVAQDVANPVNDGDLYFLDGSSTNPGIRAGTTTKSGTTITQDLKLTTKSMNTASPSSFATDTLLWSDDADPWEVQQTHIDDIPVSAWGDATSTVDMGSQKIIDLADPTVAQDAATKAYVDSSVAGGLNVKGGFNANTGIVALTSVSLYTATAVAVGDYYIVTTAGDFFGQASTPLTVGDSVLVQTASAAPALITDFAVIQSDTDLATLSIVGLGNVNASIDDEFLGMNVVYSAGTAKVGLGINSLTAVSTTDKASYLAIFDEDESANRKIDIQNLAAKLNPITSFAGTSSSGTSHTFTHNLGSNDVIVQLYDLAEGLTTGETVYADVTRTNTNTVTVSTATSANIRCLIQKVG